MTQEHQFFNLQKEQRRVSSVTRWNGTPQILSGYNVAIHAYNCANILLMLSFVQEVEPDGKLLSLILTHDNIEAFTGDLLAPAKDLLPEKWDDIESEVQQSIVSQTSTDEDVNYRFNVYKIFPTDEDLRRHLRTAPFVLLKLIDMYEFLTRAAEEYQVGNRTPKVIDGLKYGTKSFNNRCAQLIKDLGPDCQENNFYLRSAQILASSLRYFYREVGCLNIACSDE